MKDLKWLVISFAIPAFSLIYVPISFAELRLTPSITLREEYNDNIFLTSSDEEDDYITSINPAVNMTYDISLLTLSMDYGLNFRFYADHTERNETSLSKTQRARLETTVSPYRNIFFIKVSDEYKRVSIDERRQVALDNIFVNMTDSNNFSINPYIQYPLSKTLNAKIGYRYANIWYKEKEGNDAEDHTATISLAKELSSNITTSLSYSYLAHVPKKLGNYNKQDATLGIGYHISPRISLNSSVGQSWIDYKESTDNSSIIWNIQATYLPTPKLSLSGEIKRYLLEYEKTKPETTLRTIQAKYLLMANTLSLGAGYSESLSESVNLGAYKRRSTTGTISYHGTIPLNLAVSKTINKYSAVDREDRSTGVSLGSRIPFFIVTPKLSGGVTGNYNNSEFFPEGEKVKRYGLRLSLDYDMRITTASLGYTYNWSDSSFNSNDYKNNIIWVQARFTI